MKSKQKVRSVFKRYARIPNARPGLLGNGLGVVDDPNQAGHVYIRIGNNPAISVINKVTASINNLSVWVGRNEIEPDIIQVLGIRSIQRAGSTGLDTAPQVGKHGDTHHWSGRDPVFADIRQLMPYRPQVNGTMILSVYHGVSFVEGTWIGVTGQSINMTPYVPPTGSSYSLVYFDGDGLLDAVTGTVKDLNTLLLEDAPAPIPGTIPTTLVRLWAGMSGIVEARIGTDVVDVRWGGIYSHAFVPSTGAYTSTSWDGDAFSTTAKTLIDLSAVFGMPPKMKAVLAYVTWRDIASATNNCYLILSPNNTPNTGVSVGAHGQPDNKYMFGQLIVPCDSNGDIWYQIISSTGSSMNIYLQFWGYWI